MDNKTESTNIKETSENIENSDINLNNDNNKDTQHDNIEEETKSNSQPQEESTPNIISDQKTTQQVSESPIISSNLNIPAASKFASDVIISTSIVGSNVAAHQISKSRHQLSNSEAFINLDDNVSMSIGKNVRTRRFFSFRNRYHILGMLRYHEIQPAT